MHTKKWEAFARRSFYLARHKNSSSSLSLSFLPEHRNLFLIRFSTLKPNRLRKHSHHSLLYFCLINFTSLPLLFLFSSENFSLYQFLWVAYYVECINIEHIKNIFFLPHPESCARKIYEFLCCFMFAFWWFQLLLPHFASFSSLILRLTSHFKTFIRRLITFDPQARWICNRARPGVSSYHLLISFWKFLFMRFEIVASGWFLLIYNQLSTWRRRLFNRILQRWLQFIAISFSTDDKILAFYLPRTELFHKSFTRLETLNSQEWNVWEEVPETQLFFR